MTGDLSGRPYAGPQDLRAILHLIRSRPRPKLGHYPGSTDLQELLALPESQRRTRLWLGQDGSIYGYAILDLFTAGGRLVYEARFSNPVSGHFMIALSWALLGMQTVALQRGRSQTLIVPVRDDPLRQFDLEARGFVQDAVSTVHLERSLREPIKSPDLPPGFRLGLGAQLADTWSWVALHRAAHQSEEMTLKFRRAMLSADCYDPQLDLVAVSPAGDLAAYCMAHIDGVENELTGRLIGYTDPLATHPNYQGIGLAQGLLGENLRRLRSRGMDWAGLSTSSANVAMLRVAQKAGFNSVASTRFFRRMVTG